LKTDQKLVHFVTGVTVFPGQISQVNNVRTSIKTTPTIWQLHNIHRGFNLLYLSDPWYNKDINWSHYCFAYKYTY